MEATEIISVIALLISCISVCYARSSMKASKAENKISLLNLRMTLLGKLDEAYGLLRGEHDISSCANAIQEFRHALKESEPYLSQRVHENLNFVIYPMIKLSEQKRILLDWNEDNQRSFRDMEEKFDALLSEYIEAHWFARKALMREMNINLV